MGTGSALKKLESAERLSQRMQTLWPQKCSPKAPRPSKMGSKSHPKPSQDASLGSVYEAIANLLFLAHFLTSFWEPSGSHFRTFGSHLAKKRRLETNLVFHAFFRRCFDHFWGVRPRVRYGIYQSKRVFASLGKVTFWNTFWPHSGTLFDPKITQMEARNTKKHLSENTLKKDTQKEPFINLS